jgi:hypothetical protein
MQFVAQFLFSALASNEVFQDLEFLLVTRLDSLRIVKNITCVIREHKLVIDPVFPSLTRPHV